MYKFYTVSNIVTIKNQSTISSAVSALVEAGLDLASVWKVEEVVSNVAVPIDLGEAFNCEGCQ